MTTIHDVARNAGVSAASVSRYLAGSRVLASDAISLAIDELGYSPNLSARSLRSGRHKSIGLVIPDVMNPFFAALVKGIEQETRGAAYQVLLGNSDEDPGQEETVVEMLLQRVDGMIVIPIAVGSSVADALSAASVPVLLVDRQFPNRQDFDSVLVDNESGARQAIDHLARLGHQRIACISGPLGSTPGRGRYDGFIAGLHSLELEVDDHLVVFSDFSERGGYDAMRQLWKNPHRPTAVFAANNLMMQGALTALNDLDVTIPDDISIIGFDDLSYAPLLNPPPTVIEHPEVEQGAAAARVLLRRLSGELTTQPQNITLPVHIVERRSTAPPHSANVTNIEPTIIGVQQ